MTAEALKSNKNTHTHLKIIHSPNVYKRKQRLTLLTDVMILFSYAHASHESPMHIGMPMDFVHNEY